METSKLTTRVEVITPEQAREYLKMNTTNRPLSKGLVERYAAEMRGGGWKTNGEAICFAENGALFDGQHRLSAIIKAGVPVEMLVVRGCDNDSFMTYDSGKTRTAADVMGALGVVSSTCVAGIVRRYILMRDGLALATIDGRKKQSKNHCNVADLYKFYQRHTQLVESTLRLVQRLNKKARFYQILELGGMVLYLVLEKSYDFDFIAEFLEQLHTGYNITNNTILVLRNRLIQDGFATNKMDKVAKSALLVKTWNAYVSKKEYQRLAYNPADELPKFI
jgi:hypothetical protein